MKTCNKCGVEKELNDFNKNKTMKDGLEPWCRECRSEARKKNYKNNRETQLAWNKERNEKPEVKEHRRKYREQNKEKLKLQAAAWRKANRSKKNAEWALYCLSKLQRTPKWLTEEQLQQIKVEYELAAWCTKVMGGPYHVDHILPIRGKNVSGLHVPWNLQVIRGAENMSKGNRHG